MRVSLSTSRGARLNHCYVSRRALLKTAFGIAGAASLASLIAACGDNNPDDDDDAVDADGSAAEDEEVSDDPVDEDTSEVSIDEVIDELPEGFEPPDSPELDLETLEADLLSETVQAEPYDNTFVGEVTDDLFIAVSLGGSYPQGSDEITVYLCDDELSIYLTGELDEDDEATLSDDEAEVDFAIEDGEIVGNVALAGEDPVPFTAVEATGDAGLYAAELGVDNVDMTQRWIVLSDGRQRGNNICCVTHPRTGQRVCYPCWHLN